MLLCNYRKCRTKLTVSAVVTACRHIFCNDHNPSNNRGANNVTLCPVCKTRIKEGYDFIEPGQHFRNMILMGQAPETIMDICGRAMEFYMYQKAQEITYYTYLNDKLMEQHKHLEVQCRTLLAGHKDKFKKLSKECQELRDNVVTYSQKCAKLQRELEKLSLNRNFESSIHQGSPKDPNNIGMFNRVREPSSDEIILRKFPRSSPTSAYPSPAHFVAAQSFNSREFNKQILDNSMNVHGKIFTRSPDITRDMKQMSNESLQNLTRLSRRTLYP